MTGAPGSLDWVFALAAAIVGGSGLTIVILALFRDRSRGRRRCPRCWYDMEGIPGLVCPECGHAASGEPALFRRRRHRRRAWAGAALVMLALLVAGFPVYQRGWPALVPGWLLVLVAPAGDPPSQVPVLTGLPVLGPLFARAPGNIGDRLTTETWNRFLAQRLWGWEESFFTSRYLSSRSIDLREAFEMPERWRFGEPVPMAVRRLQDINSACRAPFALAVTVNGTPVAAGVAHWDGPAELREGLNTLDVRVRVQLGGRTLHEARRDAPCELVRSPQLLLAADADDATTDRVRKALRPYLSWSGQSAALICGDRSSAALWQSLNMGIAFELQVVLDGEVLGVAEGATVWPRPVWKAWQEITPRWTEGGLAKALKARDSLRLIVRGRAGEAEQEFETWPFRKRARFWAGVFEVPARLAPDEKPFDGAPR